ncbi:unknown [Acidiphilium sp. CAG:727]|nr:unknown [Acidiphilium sp. CAG:727]
MNNANIVFFGLLFLLYSQGAISITQLFFRMTLCHIQRETTSGKAGTLSAEFCRHVVQIVIDVLFHGERFGYIEVDRLLTVASDNAVGFTFH